MRRHIITKEEKVAKTIMEKLSDLTLDLEMLGYYLALNVSGVLYNRFQIVAETAIDEKEKQNGRNHI
mgnify:CR=1 FL=1|jgi:hypothetical protein